MHPLDDEFFLLPNVKRHNTTQWSQMVALRCYESARGVTEESWREFYAKSEYDRASMVAGLCFWELTARASDGTHPEMTPERFVHEAAYLRRAIGEVVKKDRARLAASA